MSYEDAVKELEKDWETIASLQQKYYDLLCEHMRLKKDKRDISWGVTRTLLFHVQGALSMARNAFASQTRRYKNEF